MQDARYRDIEVALSSQALNPDEFEAMAVALANDFGIRVLAIAGGSDAGFDGAVHVDGGEPGPLVVTTSSDVIANLTKSLRAARAERPFASKCAVLVTNQSLTPRRHENLRARARELGFTLTDVFDRPAVAEFLHKHGRWSLSLLGIPDDSSALSVLPLSRRPLHDVPLLHRDALVAQIGAATADTLLVGPPAAGKTAILRRLAELGQGMFVTTPDISRVLAALRHDCPRLLFIDELDKAPTACAQLVHARSEQPGLCFRLVVTAWTQDSQVQHALGVDHSAVVELDQLPLSSMVEVVRAVGLAGPPALVDDIVRQAEGLPGLGVALAVACLRGDVRDVLSGEVIAREFYVALERLFGQRDEPAQVLAAFAVGGRRGMALGPVSTLIGVSQPVIRNRLTMLFRHLQAGGFVAPLDETHTVVRPKRLRSVLIRDYLLAPPALDLTSLVREAPDYSLAIRELVGAAEIGAAVGGLQGYVESSQNPSVYAAFAGLGVRESRWVLEAHPDMAAEVSQAVLYHTPDIAIPALMQLAIADDRPLHSNPDHPLRRLGDWVDGASPGQDAVRRRRLVINAALEWLKDRRDARAAIHAAALALRTEFSITQLEPGPRIKMTWVSGLCTTQDIAAIAAMWNELAAVIEQGQNIPWLRLLETARRNAFPSPQYQAGTSKERTASRKFAKCMVIDIARLAVGHAGVVAEAADLATHLKIRLGVEVDIAYSALFGNILRSDWGKANEEKRREIERLADRWSQEPPSVALEHLRQLSLAAAEVHAGDDRSGFLCERLAQLASDPAAWLHEVIRLDLGGQCAYPFLVRVLKTGGPEATSAAAQSLKAPQYRSAAITYALTASPPALDLLDSAFEYLPDFSGMIRTLAIRNQMPPDILGKLLEHPESIVAEATAVGMWTPEHGVTDESLLDRWRVAVTRSHTEEYPLGEILENDSELACAWFRTHQNERDCPLMYRNSFLRKATAALTETQRVVLVKSMQTGWRDDYLRALVGESESAFRTVLSMTGLGDYRLSALTRDPDPTWVRFVGIALDSGLQPQQAAAAAVMMRSRSWSGPESAMWQVEMAKFEPFASDADKKVSEVAGLCLQYFQLQIEHALERERHEAIYGFDGD